MIYYIIIIISIIHFSTWDFQLSTNGAAQARTSNSTRVIMNETSDAWVRGLEKQTICFDPNSTACFDPNSNDQIK